MKTSTFLFRFRALPGLLLLALLPGCLYMPRVRSARSLLYGQSEQAYTLRATHFSLSGQDGSVGTTTDTWNFLGSGEWRSGLPLRGLEWGLGLDTALNLASDLKYEPWIPLDPEQVVGAVDAEAAVSPIGYSGEATLLVTKPWPRVELTGGVGAGAQSFNGNSSFLSNYSSIASSSFFSVYGYLPNSPTFEYLDLEAGLRFNFNRNALDLSLTFRDPLNASENLAGGGTVSYSPAISFSATWETNFFVHYSGSHWKLPRNVELNETPYSDGSYQEHMALAKQLYQYRLYTDAADEYNAALTQKADDRSAYLGIAYSLYALKEWDLSYYNFVMAQRCGAPDPSIEKWIRALRPKMDQP